MGSSIQTADWASKDQICIRSYEFLQEPRRTKFRLSLIDLKTGLEVILDEFEMGVNRKIEANGTSATGILKTIEGNRYFLYSSHDASGRKVQTFAEPFIKSDSSRIMSDHFLEWIGNRLLRITIDRKDSIRLIDYNSPHIIKQPDISSDGACATDFGIVFNLLDSTQVSLNSMLGPRPESTYICEIYRSVFNPVANELAFAIACEGEFNHREIHKSRMGTYDCTTGEMIVLDSTLGLTDCYMPEYSHGGRRISFISGRKSYILTRKFRQF